MSTEASPHVRDDGWGFLEVDTLGRLRDAKLWPGGGRNSAVIRCETRAAIDEYNRLAAAGRRVAALLHSTC